MIIKTVVGEFRENTDFGTYYISAEDFCYLPHTTGNRRCGEMIPRFYYNEEANACQRFYYGGCGATKNNFATLFACKMACVFIGV